MNDKYFQKLFKSQTGAAFDKLENMIHYADIEMRLGGTLRQLGNFLQEEENGLDTVDTNQQVSKVHKYVNTQFSTRDSLGVMDEQRFAMYQFSAKKAYVHDQLVAAYAYEYVHNPFPEHISTEALQQAARNGDWEEATVGYNNIISKKDFYKANSEKTTQHMEFLYVEPHYFSWLQRDLSFAKNVLIFEFHRQQELGNIELNAELHFDELYTPQHTRVTPDVQKFHEYLTQFPFQSQLFLPKGSGYQVGYTDRPGIIMKKGLPPALVYFAECKNPYSHILRDKHATLHRPGEEFPLFDVAKLFGKKIHQRRVQQTREILLVGYIV